ncbi:hypothetical protein ACFLWD_03735 [Chloroflexota bacterium]
MKGESLTARWNNIFSIVIGIAALIFVIVVLTGIIDPITRESWVSFTVLVIIGGIGCAVNELNSTMRFKPTKWRWKRHAHPLTIIGQVLGIFVLILIIFTYMGKSIGFITGYSTAFPALAAIIFIKIGINIGRNAVLK